MTLSGRMQRKLCDAGFVNISGLHAHRPYSDAEFVGDCLQTDDLGCVHFAILVLQDAWNEGDGGSNDVLVCVDALVTQDGEVWVAPEHTCNLVAVRSLVRKLAPNGHRDRNLGHYDFVIKVEDFLKAAAPKMNWALERNRVYR